ncbi:biopolymer transporter ExbD [uncultured Amphritea sp.]|uniref:ExbD/TolR family protein n=1 Tax=uncultured Amphritea sp. TaxID=981605 RepID=UPI00260FC979|nr:biopolymer transporter ExbD [uncultured Amphritea sp.]
MLTTDVVKRRPQNDDNMIPLINVVFLMLIFFMIAGQVQPSDAVPIELPGSVIAPNLDDSGSVELLVSATGTLFIDGRQLSINELSQSLSSKVDQTKDANSFRVHIKADASLEAQTLQEILRNIKAAGLTHVSLITRKQEG